MPGYDGIATHMQPGAQMALRQTTRPPRDGPERPPQPPQDAENRARRPQLARRGHRPLRRARTSQPGSDLADDSAHNSSINGVVYDGQRR